MVALGGLCGEAGLNVPQALSIGQLGERHDPILCRAGQRPHRPVASIARDDPVERAPRQEIHQLREQRLARVHGRVPPEHRQGEPPRVQVDTTENRPKTVSCQGLAVSLTSANRTLVTLYDNEGFQVANSLNRFAVSSWMPFKYGPDGSLDLYFQNASPGADKEANWLPAPKGPFNLTMRLYAPKSDALTGKWNPPPVTKEAQQTQLPTQ